MMTQSEEIYDRQTDLALQVLKAATMANNDTLPFGQKLYRLTEYQARQSHIVGLLNTVALEICVLNGMPLDEHGLPNKDEMKKVGDALVNVADGFVIKPKEASSGL